MKLDYTKHPAAARRLREGLEAFIARQRVGPPKVERALRERTEKRAAA